MDSADKTALKSAFINSSLKKSQACVINCFETLGNFGNRKLLRVDLVQRSNACLAQGSQFLKNIFGGYSMQTRNWLSLNSIFQVVKNINIIYKCHIVHISYNVCVYVSIKLNLSFCSSLSLSLSLCLSIHIYIYIYEDHK